ncbi:unnamed protein product [Gongylonema pulchrum]|uniref:Signal recognition particle-docking protein FtsY n=1 Tax=Gongylonema pulchrum TaxID=637853 RepID=A0A183E4Q2_9BILA|nr:unnamed protein product [Gongylonema pulchrum]
MLEGAEEPGAVIPEAVPAVLDHETPTGQTVPETGATVPEDMLPSVDPASALDSEAKNSENRLSMIDPTTPAAVPAAPSIDAEKGNPELIDNLVS